MSILSRFEIESRLAATDATKLWVDPLLDRDQIGEVTIDLRLGYDFLIPILTRKPMISLVSDDVDFRGLDSYYQPTRRQLGDRFLLYPGQVVLATTLEYVALPPDIYADLVPRSSYARLGMHFSTMMQPGFRGCFPLELPNSSNNPIELVVGSRLVQAKLFDVGDKTNYNGPIAARKYFGNIRPVVSRAPADEDLKVLDRMAKKRAL